MRNEQQVPIGLDVAAGVRPDDLGIDKSLAPAGIRPDDAGTEGRKLDAK